MVKDKKVKLGLGIAIKGDLMLQSFTSLLEAQEEYNILAAAQNSKDFFKALKKGEFLPPICIIDINVKGSYSLVQEIKLFWPKVKVLVLSNAFTEYAAFRMIYAGASGFVSKHATVVELRKAITDVFKKGVYHSKEYPKEIFERAAAKEKTISTITERQLEMLQHCMSNANYAEIADKMQIGVRGVDTLKETLFKKFSVKNRTDLVMLALKSGLITYEQ